MEEKEQVSQETEEKALTEDKISLEIPVNSSNSLEEFNKQQDIKKEENKKKKRNILFTILFILANIAAIVVLIVLENKNTNKVDFLQAMNLLGQNVGWTILAFSMFFIVIIFDSIVFSILIKKINGKTNGFIQLSIKTSFLGRYFDRITPWSIGGEPYQIFYLTYNKIKPSNTLSITSLRHIYRFFITAIGVIIIIATSQIATNIYVMLGAILGVAGGLIVPVFLLICALRPKLGEKLITLVVKIGVKLRIVKDVDAATNKIENEVLTYSQNIKFGMKNIIIILIIGLAGLVELFAMNFIPFFVIKALGITNIEVWETFVLCIYVNYAASFIPLPGGAGIAELSFYAVFATFFDNGILFWAILIWRVCYFYMPIFIGFILQLSESIKVIVKNRK